MLSHTKNCISLFHTNTMKLSSLLPLLLVFFPSCFALLRDFSIVGYSESDLGSTDRLIDLFESWISKHGKSYQSFNEKLHRFEIFKDNLKHIDETNKQRTRYWLGLNEFADLSHEEFKQRYLGVRTELARKRESSSGFRYADALDLPKSVDWRKKGAVTHVKDQGQCGKQFKHFTPHTHTHTHTQKQDHVNFYLILDRKLYI